MRRAGCGGALVVRGLPGVGKSALLAHAEATGAAWAAAAVEHGRALLADGAKAACA